MQGAYKVSEIIEVTYQAASATTGLTDVIMEIYDELGAKDLSNFPDVTMTEIVSSGEYKGTFTPDLTGTWRVVIDSVVKPGQVIKQFDIVGHNIDSIGNSVGGLNNLSTIEVNAEVDQALIDFDVAKASDLVSPPMVG